MAEGDGQTTNVPAMPDGGHAKFYNTGTGDYNWQAHAIEAEFQRDQARSSRTPDVGQQQAATDNQQQQPAALPTADQLGQAGDAAAAANAVGIDWAEANQIISEHGNLPQEYYDRLASIGIDEATVENYIRGMKMMADSFQQEIAQYAGGQATLDQVMNWAAENVPEEEKDGLNAMLADPSQYKAALDHLRVRMGQNPTAAQREPNIVPGQNTAAQTGDGSVFANMNELAAAQANPLYKMNTPEGEQYRRDIIAKAQRSNLSQSGGVR